MWELGDLADPDEQGHRTAPLGWTGCEPVGPGTGRCGAGDGVRRGREGVGMRWAVGGNGAGTRELVVVMDRTRPVSPAGRSHPVAYLWRTTGPARAIIRGLTCADGSGGGSFQDRRTRPLCEPSRA